MLLETITWTEQGHARSVSAQQGVKALDEPKRPEPKP